MKNKLVAVDLDGTLIDTRMVNYESYRMALEEMGFSLSYECYEEECFGKYYLDFLPQLMGDNPSDKDIERVHERKKMLYASCTSAGRLNKGLFDILAALRATGEWHTALVTTGSSRNAEEILRAFNCYDLFDLVLTSADVSRNKPDPEGYLLAMSTLNVLPENTVIFEDSGTGLAAAMASGAKVFRVERF